MNLRSRTGWAAVVVAVVLACSRVVSAQTGAALLLNPLLSEDERAEGRADAIFFNDGQTDHGNDFGLSIYQTNGRVREQRQNFVPRIGWDVSYLDLDTDEPGLPGELLDASVGIGVDINTFKGWRGGLALGLGYAGDIPFNQGDAWYGKGTLVFGKDLDKQTTLAFVLDYDGARSIFPDFPVPGFAYRHQFDPHLSYTVGIPVNNIVWKPSQVPGLRVDLSWVFVDSFEAHVDYEVVRHLVVFGQLNTINRAFHTEQIEGNNRLLFFQRRAEIGLRYQPWAETTLTGAVGYAWGGEFSAGFDTRDADAVADVSDEPYVRIGFETRF